MKERFKDTRGMSLLEVLISLLILAVGLLGLVGLQVTAIEGNRYAGAKTAAINLAMNKLEELRGLQFMPPNIDPQLTMVNNWDQDNDGVIDADSYKHFFYTFAPGNLPKDTNGLQSFIDKELIKDHVNSDGVNPDGSPAPANPIDAEGNPGVSGTGGQYAEGWYYRLWNVFDIDSDGNGTIDTKNICVIVTWVDMLGQNRRVAFSTIITRSNPFNYDD